MKITLVSFTINGGKICALLQDELNRRGHNAVGYCKYETTGINILTRDVISFTETAFNSDEAIVFIGAAGIAVRAIAPFVKSKQADPAVIVIDDTAKYVIPILSGHIGGANSLALSLSKIISAQPIITTATDCNCSFAVDNWADNNNCHIANVQKVKYISAAVLKGEKVGLYSEFPIEGNLPEGLILSKETQVGICISLANKQFYKHTLHLIPKQYVLGIGCRRDINFDSLKNLVNSILMNNNISRFEIKSMASIDLKSDELALIRLSREWKIPFHTYSAQELSSISGEYEESSFVNATTGVGNVCERAAVIDSSGELVLKKTCRDGITVAIAKREWRCVF